MTKYPLIEAMGLEIVKLPLTNIVCADELEKALQAAPVAYGYIENDDILLMDKLSALEEDNKHQARVVCIQLLKKKTKAEAALELLKEIFDDDSINLQGKEHNYIIDINDILEME